MSRRAYRTNLSDAEWAILESFVPAPLPGGRPITWSQREIVNAMLYVLRTGCQWYLLPHDFPPYKTVSIIIGSGGAAGCGSASTPPYGEALRIQLGRDPQPSAALLDSQSVKTTEKGATWLRWRQAGERPQTAYPGRYQQLAAQSARSRGGPLRE